MQFQECDAVKLVTDSQGHDELGQMTNFNGYCILREGGMSSGYRTASDYDTPRLLRCLHNAEYGDITVISNGRLRSKVEIRFMGESAFDA
ncbi:hypothetical protein CDAR_207511 [Caerostris darwini]|uniref:Uncharacterized protein n=1 Tax=Caerostris darwini TaxID=1538125 RepID=A0AAV4VGP0_9ARAC|nr:hypothetical protein CDAR_207511 [Caerostris darwini]